MKRLFQFLRRLWIRHDLWVLETAIADEVKRHDEFPDRLEAWQRELARRRGDLALLDRNRKRASFLLAGLRSPK